MGTEKVAIKDVREKGKGLFALIAFLKGDFIAEYTGTKIPTEGTETSDSRYLFEIDDTWTIDGETEANIGRWLNHSCEPNCEAQIEEGKIIIRAFQSIRPGAELTIDYDEEYFRDFLDGHCECGSKKCRGSRAPNEKPSN